MASSPALIAQRMGAFLGLLGVLLGAFAAHGLKPFLLLNATVDIWQTAVFYQFVHALAMLAAGRDMVMTRGPLICWAIGILFFSGSLYLLALAPSQRWIGPITPLGGTLLMVGWGWVLWNLFHMKKSS